MSTLGFLSLSAPAAFPHSLLHASSSTFLRRPALPHARPSPALAPTLAPPSVLPRPLAPTMQKSEVSLTTRIASVLVVISFVAVSFLPILSSLSPSALSPSDLDARLAPVPVFAVTDDTGKPYLSTEPSNPAVRTGKFYLDPRDAESFRDEVVAELRADGEGVADGVVVFPMRMDQALPFVERGEREKREKSKLAGLSVIDEFKFVAGKRELEEARKVLGDDVKDGAVPLFYVEGLAFEKDGKTVFPLFFTKEQLDQALEKAQEGGADAKSKPVVVYDLAATLEEMKTGKSPQASQVVFYPAPDALQYVKQLKLKEGGK